MEEGNYGILSNVNFLQNRIYSYLLNGDLNSDSNDKI